MLIGHSQFLRNLLIPTTQSSIHRLIPLQYHLRPLEQLAQRIQHYRLLAEVGTELKAIISSELGMTNWGKMG